MNTLRCTAAAAAFATAMLSTNASAVNSSTDGVGEVAIAPFYTVRDGWSTLINLTNTTANPIVVKVRFHEALNSRDTLDFLVALSGYDVFTGELADSVAGPVFKNIQEDDRNSSGLITCTVPSYIATNSAPNAVAGGTPMSVTAFSGTALGVSNSDGGPATGDAGFDRMREGYVEFIVMGRTLGSKTGAVTAGGVVQVGNAIERHDCAALDLALGTEGNNPNTGVPYILESARQFGEPVSALKFNFRLVNRDRGTEAGNLAHAWSNFYNEGGIGATDPVRSLLAADGTPAPATPANLTTIGYDPTCTITRGDQRAAALALANIWVPGDGAGASCPNLITLQRPHPFLEPSLNDAFPQVANWYDDAANAARAIQAVGNSEANRLRGVDAMSLTMQRSAVLNEWSSVIDAADNRGVATDWVVTLPTKGFYVDKGAGVQFAIATGIPAGGFAGAGDTGRPEANLSDGVPNGVGGLAVPYPPFERAFARTIVGDPTSAKACNVVNYQLFDRAEQAVGQGAPGGPVPSPAPTPERTFVQLCYEANVITFGGRSALRFGEQDQLASDTIKRLNRLRTLEATFTDPVTTVDPAVLPAPQNQNGWMRLTLNQQQSFFANQPVLTGFDLDAAANVNYTGLPVIGMLVKVRNFNDATKNFASSIDHGYERSNVLLPE